MAIQDRFVEVIAEVTVGSGPEGSTSWEVASGFLVDGRHVLTCLHAVVDGFIIVRRAIPWPDGLKQSWQARVLLAGDLERADLAILELSPDAPEDIPQEIARLTRVGFARVADRTRRLEEIRDCGALGFPRFLERGDGAATVRHPAHVSGRIPVSQRPGPGLLTLQTTHRPDGPPLPPTGTTLAGSAWSGMSGAAVLAGELVVGVVSEHAPRQGASDLTVVPITLIDTLPDRAAWWTLLGTSPDRLPALPELGRDAVPMGSCPYQGLAPFGADQAALFYGRGQATARLLAMITAERDGGGLIMVTGASGAGKSSLLHAGLLPALTAAFSGPADAASWPQIRFTSGERPLQELAIQLAQRCGAVTDVVLGELRDDPAQAAVRARQVLSAEAIRHHQQGGSGETPRRLIMIVDQFEELFTPSFSGHAEEAAAFVAALEAIATPADPLRAGQEGFSQRDTGEEASGGRQSPRRSGREPPGIVVVAVRGDFLDRCAAHPALARALEERAFVLGPMSEQELQRAITGPAAAAGLTVEDGLAEQVVRDLIDHTRSSADGAPGGGSVVGALPLLSMAMVRTWHNRHDGRLTLRGYDDAGGVASAVQDAAEDAYRDLSARQQEAAKRVILGLTLTGADGQVSRQRAVLAELTARCEPEEPELALDVVTAFTGARLMVTGSSSPAQVPAESPDETTATAVTTARSDSSTTAPDTAARLADATPASTVELAHDVLLSAWPRLRSWLTEDQADRILHGEIWQDATEWDQTGRDASFLYQGTRLKAAQSAAARWAADPRRYRNLSLSTITRSFLAASRQREHRGQRIQRWVMAGFAVLGLALLAAGGVTFLQWLEATQQRDIARASRIVAEADRQRENDAALSAQLALAAHRMRAGDDTFTRVISGANSALFTPLLGHADTVTSIAYRPDGRVLASAGDDLTIRLWDLSDAAHPVPLGRPISVSGAAHRERASQPMVFTPDGRTLIGFAGDETIRAWDVSDPAHPVPLGQPITRHDRGVTAIALSPDGRTLASGDHVAIQLWDVTDIARPLPLGRPLTGHAREISALAFTGDGHVMASADGQTVRLWNLDRLAKPAPSGVIKHPGVKALALAGETLASVGDDKTIRLWNISRPARRSITEAGKLTFEGFGPRAIALSPDSRTLAVADDSSRSISLWDISAPERPAHLSPSLTGHTLSATSLAFGPDGRTLASVSYDQSLLLWNLPSSRLAVEGDAKAFGASGRMLASLHDRGSLQLWDVPDSGKPHPRGQPLRSQGDSIDAVAISPDGQMLAIGDRDGHIALWDLSDPARPSPLSPPLPASEIRALSAAFSPDGRFLAVGNGEGTIRLWDITDPARPLPLGQPIPAPAQMVHAVAFSPDGATLAAAADELMGTSSDQYIALWRISDPAHPTPWGKPLSGHTGSILTLAFSPDRQTLASGGDDGTVRLWDLSDPAAAVAKGQPILGHVGSITAMAFRPDGRTLAVTSSYREILLWSLDVDQAARRICAITKGSLTAAKWREYFGDDIPYTTPCP